jgi:hypothetical protein
MPAATTYNGSCRFVYDNSRAVGYMISALPPGVELEQMEGDFPYAYTATEEVPLRKGSEAWHLRDAYKRVAAGVSILSIAEEWNRLGVKTTAARRPNKPGAGTWTQQTLKLMLSTGFAAGWIRERSKPTAETRKTARLDSFDVWRKGAHPQIITDATWEAVKARLLSNAAQPHRWVWAVSPLSGLLLCGLCLPEREIKMVMGNNGRQRRWICSRRRDNRDIHPPLTLAVIRSEKLVLDWLDNNAEPPADIDARAEAAKGLDQALVDIADLDKRISDAQAESLMLSRQVAKGLIPDSDAALLRREHDAQLAALTKARQEAEVARTRLDSTLPNFPGLRQAWPSLDAQAKREALLAVVKHFIVLPGDEGHYSAIRPVPRWTQ